MPSIFPCLSILSIHPRVVLLVIHSCDLVFYIGSSSVQLLQSQVRTHNFDLEQKLSGFT